MTASVNIWQVLFALTLVVYGLHMYILSHDDAHPGSALNLRNVKPPPKSSARPSVIVGNAIRFPNLEGEINGKPFVILNDRVDSDLEAYSLERLDSLKEITPKSQMVKDFGPKTLAKLRYMHIPRTGAAFVHTVVHYCCKHVDDIEIDYRAKYDMQPWKLDSSCRPCLKQPITANGEYWSYFPFLPNDQDQHHTVALFREPTVRIASQIVEMRSLRGMMIAFGIPKPDVDLFTDITTNKFNESFAAFSARLKQRSELVKGLDATQMALFTDFLQVSEQCYAEIVDRSSRDRALVENCRWQMAARYPGIRGCQTRMVLGRSCVEAGTLTDADMTLAKKRLQDDFAFVGLTSEWNSTVQAFHRKFGGRLYQDEQVWVRAKVSYVGLKQKVADALSAAGYSDPWDEDLFRHATQLFARQ